MTNNDDGKKLCQIELMHKILKYLTLHGLVHLNRVKEDIYSNKFEGNSSKTIFYYKWIESCRGISIIVLSRYMFNFHLHFKNLYNVFKVNFFPSSIYMRFVCVVVDSVSMLEVNIFEYWTTRYLVYLMILDSELNSKYNVFCINILHFLNSKLFLNSLNFKYA